MVTENQEAVMEKSRKNICQVCGNLEIMSSRHVENSMIVNIVD